MIQVVRTMTPVIYVESLDRAIAFYQLIGFEQVLHGDDGEWSWSYAKCGELGLLIAQDGRSEAQRGPVQLYFATDDVAAVQKRLADAEVAVEHLGYPDHAPGGEIRTTDPDGRVVMVAQTTGAPPEDATRPDTRISILQQAANALRERGGAPHECEVGEADGRRCRRAAEVKLADGWGDAAWSCLPHADEVLFTVRGAFVASEDAEGLGVFLTRRRRLR